MIKYEENSESLAGVRSLLFRSFYMDLILGVRLGGEFAIPSDSGDTRGKECLGTFQMSIYI